MAKPRNQNARTHGLTARNENLTPEQAASLQAFIAEFVDELQPEGPTERSLVTHIAKCQWRLDRIADTDIATGYHDTLPDDPKLTRQIDFLGRHEARLYRMARDARKELRTLQQSRLQQEAAWREYEAEQQAHEDQQREADAFRARYVPLASAPPPAQPPLSPDPIPSSKSNPMVDSPEPTEDISTDPDFDARIDAATEQTYALIGRTLNDYYRDSKIFAELEKRENENRKNDKV
jgi:hypothetical protein